MVAAQVSCAHSMRHGWLITMVGLMLAGTVFAQSTYQDFDQPPHNYWQRPLKDRFTRLKARLASGEIPLDRSSEKAFLASLLKALDISPHSQMLVFSTTSLQLSLIKPSNPRALYFNEDVYVGFIPGGRIEVLSLDPDLGGIYYIFNIPRGLESLNVERATRCMNCHAGDDTHRVPGLVIKSVIPGPGGGSLTAYRIGQTGHQIPFSERFGGWYVTGRSSITNHWGNLTGRLSSEGLTTYPLPPGERFDFAKYVVPTSDILPQLLHEHQAGFVNRVMEGTYRARSALAEGKGKLNTSAAAELDRQAATIVRYALFADEAPLPQGGVEGDALFKRDFLGKRQAVQGKSLKDFELKTRLFQYRCSYMVYSPVFQGMPEVLKMRVYQRMERALSEEQPDKDYAYLPKAEKRVIRQILKGTLRDWPAS